MPRASADLPRTIHNPAEPRHYMEVTPATVRQIATIDRTVVASSDDAIVVSEVGRHAYAPVVYFPRDDVDPAALVPIDTTTHCPLKGDTEYFDVVVAGERHPAAAWSYVALVTDNPLLGLIAFDASQVAVGTAGDGN